MTHRCQSRGEELANSVSHGVALLAGICVVPFLIVVARQRTTAGFLGALVFAAVPLVRKVPLPGLELLLAGGLAYTLGVLFFVLDSRLKYAHTVWHGFVTLGTGFHSPAVSGYAG